MTDQANKCTLSQCDLDHLIFALDRHAIVSVTDAAGTIIHANDKFCEISGYTRPELVGRNHRLLKSGHHSDAFYDDIWATIVAGHEWRGEIRNRRKDGSFYWVDSTIVPFRDEHGALHRFVSIRTDITRLKETQQALQNSETRFRRAMENAPIGMALVDLSGRMFAVNHTLCLFLGYEERELLATGCIDLAHPDDRAQSAASMQRLLAGEVGVVETEKRYINKSGATAWAQLSAVLVRDDNNAPMHFIMQMQDITRRKMIEQELIGAMNAAEQANRAKSEFLSRMSHELRTPLNAILGFAQMMKADGDLIPLEHHESLDHILKGGWHLLDLVSDVLDLSRIEERRLQVYLEDVSLASALRECCDLAAATAHARQIEFVLDSMPDGLTIRADQRRLKQVLLNLLSNSVKYNRDGGCVHIAVALARSGQHVRVSVRDTGIGIAQAKLAQMFQPFNRLGLEQSSVQGAGIGLVITKGLVEAMDGTLGVESQEGRGSTFWFEMPLASDADTLALQASEQLAGGHDGGLPSPHGANWTVLYVEDNPINLHLVERLVARYPQFKLLSAINGNDGLKSAQLHRPDLILLDINLPDINGHEVLQRLRADTATAATPVIAVSADILPQDISRALASGFNAYITKPIRIAEFETTLNSALRREQS